MPKREPVALGPAMHPAAADALATQLKALADPARLQVLSILDSFPGLCAQHLHPLLKLGQPTTQHHVKVLRQAGLLVGERDGGRRRLAIDYGALANIVAEIPGRAR